MKKKTHKKNPNIDFITQDNTEINVEHKYSDDPHETALWFDQLMKFDEKKRLAIVRSAMTKLKSAKPEMYDFIKKFNCQLVGISPRVEYTLSGKEGSEDLEVTWIHSFSQPTLLFWCKAGGFGLFVNSVLDFDDSVLNNIKGNPKSSLRGFTG